MNETKELLKERLIKIFQEENPGLLPDEAESMAEDALKYYVELRRAIIDILET